MGKDETESHKHWYTFQQTVCVCLGFFDPCVGPLMCTESGHGTPQKNVFISAGKGSEELRVLQDSGEGLKWVPCNGKHRERGYWNYLVLIV